MTSVHTFVGRNVPMMSDVFCVGCGPPGGGGGGTTTGPAIEFADGRNEATAMSRTRE